MNYLELKRKFQEQGFLVLHEFFNSEAVEQIDRAILNHFGEAPEYAHDAEFLERSQTEVVPWFPQNPDLPAYDTAAAASFEKVEKDVRMAELTRYLLGEDWTRLYSMVMFSRQGSKGQAWHQDCPPDEPGSFNLNRLVYTRDITDGIGGQTVVMPESHLHGELTVGDPHEDFDGQLIIRPRKGTLVMLHGHCWHRVLPVRGDYRFSTNYRACPRGVAADITDVCVYRNMRYRFSTSSVVEERRS
jgi:hypothetical protein